MLHKIIVETREIGERFKEFRQLVGKTPGDFSRETGYPEEYILLVEKGDVQPKIPFVEYFCSHYGLNLSWLASGKEKILKEENKA